MLFDKYLAEEDDGESSDASARANEESEPPKEKTQLPPLFQKKGEIHRISLYCDDEEVLDRMIAAAGKQESDPELGSRGRKRVDAVKLAMTAEDEATLDRMIRAAQAGQGSEAKSDG